jgi:hypothetical protein
MVLKKNPKNEFLEKFDTIWKEGPKIKYQTPDSWVITGFPTH